MEVPASKAIKTRSMDNVETERLHARLEHLREFLPEFNHQSDSSSRASFGDRVRECVNVERALSRRDEPFTPVTDAKHLEVDVHSVPKMGPRPSNKERRANE